MVVLLWLAGAVALAGLGRSIGGEFSDDFRVPGVESQDAIDVLREQFPEQAGGRAQLVFHVDDGTLAEPDRAAAIEDALAAVAELDHVTAAPPLIPASAVNPQGPEAERTAMANVAYELEVDELGEPALDALVDALTPAEAAGIEVSIGGDLAQYVQRPETSAAEVVGVLAAVVILLVTFGSFVGMGLPIGIALFSLAVATSLVTLLASLTDVSTTAPFLGSMIGLGVGIDYALFILTRHRQHLADGHTIEDAAGRANATSGQAVIFAGGTVVIAICGLSLAGIPMVTTMGWSAAIVVAVTVLASVSLLPALLGFAGARLATASLPWARRREAALADRRERLLRLGGEPPKSGWERWGLHVSSHPWPYLLGGVGLLLLLTVPLLGIRLGQLDAGTSAKGTSIRTAYDRVAEGFGPGFNGPLLVVLDLQGADADAVDAVVSAAGRDDDVSIVAPPQLNERGDTAIVTVIPKSQPQSAATSELVHRLRSDIIPTALEGTRVTSYVSGLTAVFIDLSDRVAQRLPWFIGAVVGLSFLLLMAVFRSVLVPLKAALLNLLSIGSAYGVVVAVFQWGWLKGLIGLEETVPIISFVPMFMFAILFGLSMDYEVFLLSRVREEYVHSRDNTASVVTGIASTARVITSAALIMICVFLGFVFGDDPIVKMMGLGLSVAVLIDATIVRIVLVPASMRLMGDANWWLPGWLDRILPSLDVEGGVGLPEPELRPDAEMAPVAL
jgi:RND superfamily putative drug exporter